MAPVPVAHVCPPAVGISPSTLLAYACAKELPDRLSLALYHHPRLARLFDFIDTHLQHEITLSLAADIACMEKTAFCKFFRRAMGMSFMRFLHIVRIDQGAKLLSSSRRGVTEIAGLVGYGDVSLFGKHFKVVTGMSPSAYRAACPFSTDAANNF